MSLIPSSIRRSPTLAALSDVAQADMAALRDLAQVLRIMDVDAVPAAVLPYLAWQLRADVWSPEAPEATRREQVRMALRIWRYRGTRYAVEQALLALGVDADLVEWWQTDPAGTPHTFAVTVRWAGVLQPAMEAEIHRVIGATKPVRSQYAFAVLIEDVSLVAPLRCGARVAARATMALAGTCEVASHAVDAHLACGVRVALRSVLCFSLIAIAE